MEPQTDNKQMGKTKNRWHKWFFGVLYVVIVLALFGLFYNVVVRDEKSGTANAEDDGTTGVSLYDTIDVMGDYLWKGAPAADAAQNEEDGKKDDDKTEKTQAAPAVQADAATEQDIEEATGLTTNNPATSTKPQDSKAAESDLDAPVTEAIE